MIRRVAATVLVLGALVGLPAAPAVAVATTVTASVSATSVVAGQAVTIRGTASGPTGRTVVLQLWTRAGWRQVASDRTDSLRRYVLRVPTSWYDRHALRVVAPAAGKADRGVSATRRVVVKPSYTPLGDATDVSYLAESRPRWDPCQAITWKFNDDSGGYAGALADLEGAFDRIHRATGLRFVYRGTTDAVAFSNFPGGRDDASTDITVSFDTPQHNSKLSGATAGLGGGAYSVNNNELFYGSLVLDSTQAGLRPGFETAGSATWGQVLQHEIGHVVGLHHANGSSQLMYGTISPSNHRMGAGDLTGFNWVGMRGGCIANSLR